MAPVKPEDFEDVEMGPGSEDNAHYYAPPAHIAARFYRKQSQRRRSSAHSSRRSSMSSLPSHRSNLSCHGGPRSTHVAQHLRRASIIETRKARLADRAAHAEQVRLRAALAKSQPRVSQTEERTLAAQAAREKFLAEITARCEEEVRRAKKVAEETKEKRAAELNRLKQEMEDKFAEAARRKLIYQHSTRRPRTSLAAVEERKINPSTLRKLSETAAAKVIQRSWRTSYRKRMIQKFRAYGMRTTQTRNMTFEDLTKLISEAALVQMTTALLQCLLLSDVNSEPSGEHGSARIFLSAFMVHAHPVQALSHGGQEDQEKDLLQKAKRLIEYFESLTSRIIAKATNFRTCQVELEHLLFLFNEFSSAFQAWRTQDLTVIIDVMVSSFVNLDMILQATKDDKDGRVAEDYFHAIRQEQVKLLAKLKRLAGPEEALSLVRTAVRKSRKQRAKIQRRPSEENVPRATSTKSTSDIEMSLASRISTPPLSPEPQQKLIEGRSLASRLSQTMTVLPPNRVIAHEIQLTGLYEIQQQPWTSSRQIFLDSLRSSLQKSMDSGDKDMMSDWTRAMTTLIRDRILNLLSQRHPLYDRFEQYLDARLIEQQTRQGMFSYSNFFETIGGLIAQICSPGRDELIAKFTRDDKADTVERLFSLMNIIDLMTLDHLNFQFRVAATPIMEHGHEHEQAHFEKDLEDGQHSLRYTRAWWSGARSLLRAAAPSSTSSVPGHIIYARALTDLVFSNKRLDISTLPETLQLDCSRLLHLRARALHLALASSILLTTKIRLRRNRESLWARDAERLLNLDLTSLPISELTTRIISTLESSHNMLDSTREGLTDFVKRVLPPAVAAAQNAKAMDEAKLSSLPQSSSSSLNPPAPSIRPATTSDILTEQVTTYHLKTLREHVCARLAAQSTAEKARATASAADVLARAGMSEFVTAVGEIVDVLERVRKVDFAGHGRWLDQIAGEVEAEQG